MKRTRRNPESLSVQVKRHSTEVPKKKHTFKGNTETMVSTGSTQLDLAITGGRIRGGGLPGGIYVEVFGPSGSGKTVLLCEIAGYVQRMGGDIRFDDPEARLNKQFAQMFDFDIKNIEYATPDTVTEVFENIRKWKPKKQAKIHGTFTDSLAALSTDMEMEKDEGDKMGQRRAKEFSEGFRKNARILKQKNYLMVCSNQVRENQDAGKYSPKYKSTGGFAIGFYASLRLRATNPEKIYKEITFRGKKIKKVIGVETVFEVFKSSIWKPYRTAPVTIIFDYGIDNIRDNLQYIKDYTKNTTYCVNDRKLAVSMEDAIKMVESEGLENELREEVINLWELIESKFQSNRKKKIR
jgi:RecA/RadA recombinase